MKRIIALLMTAILMILPSACDSNKAALREESYDAITEHTSKMTRAALHTQQSDSKKLRKISASGIIELYSDPETLAVSIKETVSGQYWHTLPPYAPGKVDNAAPVTLTIRQGSERYHWNVQENSVAFGKAASENLADGSGILITYDCYPNAEEAKNPMPSLAFRITLRYTLTDGSLVVNVSWENLAPASGALLETIGLLETFGAYAQSGKNDFLLVPDGSGAIVKTNKKASGFSQPLSFQVYGPDRAALSPNYSYSAILPVFGIRSGSSGFAAFIEQGDAIATITADRERGGGELNCVGTRFSITPTVTEENNGKVSVFSAVESYKGELAIRYRFLSGGAADYSGMAGALREEMQRRKFIPLRAVENQDKLPLNITLTASAKVKKVVEYTKTLTSFEQAQEFLTLLRARGIDNAFLQYKGATNQSANISILRRVGGAERFIELQESVRAQNMQIYLDIPFLTGTGSGSAQGLYGETIKIPVLANVSELYGAKVRDVPLRAIGSLYDPEGKKNLVTEKIIRSLRDIDPMGLSLGDLNSALCSDYTIGAQYNRQQAANEIQTQLTSFASGRKLMVPGGNFYLLRNASVVTELPSSAQAIKESGAYVSVPLVQMLLHGVVDYSFKPLNYEEDEKNREKAFLKSIEYGAIPAFDWIINVSGASDEAAGKLDYEKLLPFAASCSERSTEALADLRGARITRHTIYKTGVSSTEYESGAIIYVNSSDNPATVNGLTIAAMSFLRVN